MVFMHTNSNRNWDRPAPGEIGGVDSASAWTLPALDRQDFDVMIFCVEFWREEQYLDQTHTPAGSGDHPLQWTDNERLPPDTGA